MTTMTCTRCESYGEPLLKTKWYPGGMHLGAFCGSCESWIKWVPQNEEWVGLFNRQHDHPMYPHEKRVLKVTEHPFADPNS